MQAQRLACFAVGLAARHDSVHVRFSGNELPEKKLGVAVAVFDLERGAHIFAYDLGPGKQASGGSGGRGGGRGRAETAWVGFGSGGDHGAVDVVFLN